MASMFSRRKVLYEGKAKIIYEGTEPGTFIQYFKDDATAGNGAKKDVLAGKGVLTNRISAHIMTKLHAKNRTDLIRYALRKGLVALDAVPVEGDEV